MADSEASEISIKYGWTDTKRFVQAFENAPPSKQQAVLSHLQDLLEIRRQQNNPADFSRKPSET